MQRRYLRHQFFALISIMMLAVFLFQTTTGRDAESTRAAEATKSSYIVQASSAAVAETAVITVGGRITATLNIINAVGAELNEKQLNLLRSQSEQIKVFRDETLEVSGRPGKKSKRSGSVPGPAPDPLIVFGSARETHYPTLVGANRIHEQNITGNGVTIAVLDTGLWQNPALRYSAKKKRRVIATYDALYNGSDTDDWNGHGTHLTSIMTSSHRTDSGNYQGIAPNANVVVVRAFEPDGSGSYLSVIKALDWIVSHKNKYKIRILNLSFSAPARSHYWDDPVNQAVMAAWKKGIIVVVAAGNGGPGPMTVGVPGNVPYVITVGAMTDNYTPSDTSDDKLSSFSAAGPTFEGFVKPDLLAPGGHMLGMMPAYAWLPLEYPDYVLPVDQYFTMSGTSQATAVVSGVLALMLEADSKLQPDDAKCQLMVSARAAELNDGTHAYSVFQQGAGRVDAIAAINESTAGCANRGMNIKDDLSGAMHYAGSAGVDEYGTYYLVDEFGQKMSESAYEWSQGSLWPGGAIWPERSIWYQGSLWNSGVLWDQASSLNKDSLVSQGSIWPQGSLWTQSLSAPAAAYVWVNQE